MFDFEVKIAEGKKEIKQALRLRYEIFNLELGKGSGLKQKRALELDVDIYDKFCDHLIVIDKIIDKVVGTYRFCLGSKVDKKIGFYSEKFFDIGKIKRLNENYEILELGRSCIHRDYRCRPVINLLWSGIAKYVKDNNVRYLFGATRLLNSEPPEVSKIFKFIKEKYYAGSEFRVYPKAGNKFHGLRQDTEVKNHREILRKLPPLIRGYLNVGVLVCGLPAVNPDFGSVVIFILLDIEKISPSYREHFF
jgi:putative hemolysin